MIDNSSKYILEFNSIPPVNKEKPKHIVVLCHGYGGDGKDISMLAYNWQRFLPNTIFLSPNAPEVCSINPQGYQWFDLTTENEQIILEKSLIAEEKLSKFLDQILNNFQLEENNLALVGFSQGCMMVIQVALKKKKQINCLIGYSGKIINQAHLSNKIESKPNVFLMHGAQDTIVSPTNLLASKEFLENHGIKTKTKIFNNCEHSIPVEGVSLGLSFLKKNLL